MKRIIFVIVAGFFLSSCNYIYPDKKSKSKYVLVIHGGAGTILKENLTLEKEQQYINKLEEALLAGGEVLKTGGTSLDAVTEAIIIMENSPLFNAGKGAVFTEEGINEMDASIMDGRTSSAGAVAGVHTVKNPILAARTVMEKSDHVLLIGDGADEFARKQGLDIVDSSYFFTHDRWKSFEKVRSRHINEMEKHGTVGAVALDLHGDLAAGTSTGGMTYKMKGRVGDSPIIGAGTYADNNTCAVSATGHGEYFIRNVVAYDIAALMKYTRVSVKEAANFVVLSKLKKIGGDGGIIAVDKSGNFTMTFNTAGMYRGVITSEGLMDIKIFGDH
ncbi:MAG: isoaspartyl peptidase/L-asparaginase [Bacteroidetes bacterium]|nr:isoaspartyl peptidase/L-asparaginase [Bacteroidota bacterium]MBL6942774.1 isoaspartyl peptidase/L-asparaginase [Bacteroidales bacterium]